MPRTKIDSAEKQCPGCRELNTRSYFLCKKCGAAHASARKNGFAHYNKIERSETKKIIKFVDQIILRRGLCTAEDIWQIIDYYQVTHKLIYKYDKCVPNIQIWNLWLDLMIWSVKQKGIKLPFKEMSRDEIYKILMNNYANQSQRR
jgi:hypothetical protein